MKRSRLRLSSRLRVKGAEYEFVACSVEGIGSRIEDCSGCDNEAAADAV